MKVVSGSLDVLETVGRKTFDVSSIFFIDENFLINEKKKNDLKVINEADPELKGARRLLTKKKEPTLSEVRSTRCP